MTFILVHMILQYDMWYLKFLWHLWFYACIMSVSRREYYLCLSCRIWYPRDVECNKLIYTNYICIYACILEFVHTLGLRVWTYIKSWKLITNVSWSLPPMYLKVDQYMCHIYLRVWLHIGSQRLTARVFWIWLPMYLKVDQYIWILHNIWIYD